MTNLVAQIRALKNNDPEAGEEARGWNSAIEAVLELLPVEPPVLRMPPEFKDGALLPKSTYFSEPPADSTVPEDEWMPDCTCGREPKFFRHDSQCPLRYWHELRTLNRSENS